jgi:predicted AAA+ superfamily ATPase
VKNEDVTPLFSNIKVFASGSSSIEIHSHLNQSAVGRVRRTRIFPLSFPEWCQEKIDISIFDLDPEKIMPPRQKKRLDDLLDEFLVWGGMPEPAVLSDGMEKREDRQEVDFVLERDRQKLLIEVKSSLARDTIPHATHEMLNSVDRS